MLAIGIIGSIIFCVYAIRKYREIQWGMCKCTRRMNGKVSKF